MLPKITKKISSLLYLDVSKAFTSYGHDINERRKGVEKYHLKPRDHPPTFRNDNNTYIFFAEQFYDSSL